MPEKLVIHNIGLMLSGKMEDPILDADCIIAIDGKIAQIGQARDMDRDEAQTVVDARGVTLAPGLIDSHIHPVVGDYTPRQQQLGWIDSTLHGGVTTLISAGEVHMPGRPKDILGLKAMAIASQRWYENFRPSGMKVHAGAPVIEKGMVEQDFKDLADAGVTLLGEVGLGTVKDGKTDADMVMETGTDIIGHINGGHSALPDDQIICLCENCKAAFEIVHNGNERAAVLTINTARELGKLDQVILGTDGPAGSGVQPLGILRMVAMLSAFGNVPAEIAFCFANGNTSRQRKLDTGLLEMGMCADFVLMDQAQHAPGNSILESVQLGNLPGIGMTVIDGKVTSGRSRNTPPAARLPELVS